MKSFGFKKIKELDPSFVNYLKSTNTFILESENLLIGLQDLNKNFKSKRIIFLNSKCSDKGYVCINCENEEFENILSTLDNILKLHEFRINHSKNFFKKVKKN